MSHTVTVTRTTTTTGGSYIVLNTGYLKTVPGLLKLAQLILGAIAVGIVAYYLGRYTFASSHDSAEIFFLLMAVAFLIGTFCLLLSCLISLSTGGIISKTIYELIYHSVAFALYLVASIWFLVRVTDKRYGNLYEEFMVAAVLGLVCSILYLISAVYAHRSYRGL